MIDGDPLLVLDVPPRGGDRVRQLIEVGAAVPLRPRLPVVVRVRERDRAVRMHASAPIGVERQVQLVDTTLGVPVVVRIGVIRPVRGHRLRPAVGDTVKARHLHVPVRRSIRHRVRAEIEVVPGRIPVDEELRRPDEGFAARLHGEPRFGVIRIQRDRPAGTGERQARAWRNGVAPAPHGRAGNGVLDRGRASPSTGHARPRHYQRERER